MKILCSGACGESGRSVARALRMSPIFKDAVLIGTDIAQNIYGLYENLFDNVYKVPYCTDESYKSVVQGIIDKEKPDAALIMPELEVLFWSKNDFGVPVLLPHSGFCDIAISKKRTYEILDSTGLVPKYRLLTKEQILYRGCSGLSKPFWMRDISDGATGAKGAFLVKNNFDAIAWAHLHPSTHEFMIAEYLPGRNLACCMLFDEDRLLKVVCAERLEYAKAKVTPSGITGNTAKGRLLNNEPDIIQAAWKAVMTLSNNSEKPLSGIVTVDLKENAVGKPYITEINIRHVAFTEAWAQGGVNMAEAQMLLLLDRKDEIDLRQVEFPENNLFLRDLDGIPLYVADYNELKIGESVR